MDIEIMSIRLGLNLLGFVHRKVRENLFCTFRISKRCYFSIFMVRTIDFFICFILVLNYIIDFALRLSSSRSSRM